MSYKSLMITRNLVKHLIRISNRHRNVLKWHSNETQPHILMKLEICKYLKKNRLEFYSEAIFEKSNLRADIVVADRELIIEVFDSESKESMDKKRATYPLPIVFVKADQEFSEKLIL